MPTATNELRDLMELWFGDAIDDGGPYRFLMARGYQEWAGMLIKPTSAYTVSIYEAPCIQFLCDEWDYGFDPTATIPSQDRA
jgi:hypothetical protein